MLLRTSISAATKVSAFYNLLAIVVLLTLGWSSSHVRVRFFTSLEGLKRRDRKADLVAVFPLELSGELDLNRVKQLWGLDSCAVSMMSYSSHFFRDANICALGY